MKLASESIELGEASVFNFVDKPGVQFTGLDIPEVSFLNPQLIRNFNDARVVYLRCATRLEACKKIFPLDGMCVC